MRKIVIFNQKGGTGKSSTAVNLSGILDTHLKKKSLVIDCDSQMNSTNYLLTCRNESYDFDLVDCVNDKDVFENAILNVALTGRKDIPTRISVIPGNRNVEQCDLSEFSFKPLFDKVDKKFDYCFFDCPPHISPLTIQALSCADYVIVPALADTDSLSGYDLLIDTVNEIRESAVNVELKILGIFFNNVESNKALDRYIMESCKESMGDAVFKSSIRRTSAISQARYYGKPISYYKPTAPITEDYLNLAKELIKKISKMEDRK